jgi:hypothetical protein
MIFSAMAVDYENRKILGADTTKYMWQIEDENETTDNETTISWEIQSKAFGALRKYFPRWSRYDVNLDNGATATGTVIIDDIVKQSHPITISRDIRKRLIGGYTGDRLSIRISGTGPASIYGAEIE